MIAKYGTALGLIAGGVLALLVALGVITEQMAIGIGGAIFSITGGAVVVAKFGGNPPTSMRGYAILAAFLLAPSVANAAMYRDEFENYPEGPITYIRLGDRHVSLDYSDIVVDAYGPAVWGHKFVVPASECDSITISIDPPVYAAWVDVSSIPGKEDEPPTATFSSTTVLPYWSLTTGPGTRQASWPSDKSGTAPAGYAFLGDVEDVPVIQQIVVNNGTMGKIVVQTHPLTVQQRRALRMGLPLPMPEGAEAIE